MGSNLIELSAGQLTLSMLPALLAVGVQCYWSLDYRTTLYALLRMLGQLLLVGYVLALVFAAETAWPVLLVMGVMLGASAWIALRPLGDARTAYLKPALIALAIACFTHLALLIWLILDLSPWFNPQYLVPMAGMLFANSLNSLSLATERFFSETERGEPFEVARTHAFNAALLPLVNSLFAVGLVSLPGMMTGQILSGVDPLIAVRYQILIMSLMLGSATCSTALFLALIGKRESPPVDRAHGGS